MKKCAYSRYRRYPYSRERALESSRRNGGSPVAVAGVMRQRGSGTHPAQRAFSAKRRLPCTDEPRLLFRRSYWHPRVLISACYSVYCRVAPVQSAARSKCPRSPFSDYFRFLIQDTTFSGPWVRRASLPRGRSSFRGVRTKDTFFQSATCFSLLTA